MAVWIIVIFVSLSPHCAWFTRVVLFLFLCLPVTEKQLAERIQQLISEKSDVLNKVTELNNAVNICIYFVI